MTRKKILAGTGAFVGMLILILDGRTAIQGAQEGIELCLKAAIPSLFPYFFLSILLTNSLADIPFPILGRLGNLLGIPEGCASVLISAFLGGYPAGAQCVTQLYRGHYLEKADAERLLSFCSNAGPAFLFGIVGPMFPNSKMVWMIWLLHIMGAILAAVVIQPTERKKYMPMDGRDCSAADAVQGAARVMAAVCAWIVLFRVVITFLQRWMLWLLPIEAQVAASGFLELSNGCMALSQIADIRLRFLLCSAMLSFGGICVTMQTRSVTSGLSMKYYWLGKGVQTIFCVTAGYGLLYGSWIASLLLMSLLCLYLLKKQKNCSIHKHVGV